MTGFAIKHYKNSFFLVRYSKFNFDVPLILSVWTGLKTVDFLFTGFTQSSTYRHPPTPSIFSIFLVLGKLFIEHFFKYFQHSKFKEPGTSPIATCRASHWAMTWWKKRLKRWKKDDFHQGVACEACVCWSKYTTLIQH